MASISQEILLPYLDAYIRYLHTQERAEGCRPLSNASEDYKRAIAETAANLLNADHWNEADIGSGIIGESVIKAVQKNVNLVSSFQNIGFANLTREKTLEAETLLYKLYHNHEDEACFEPLCSLYGRKYDLIAYLFFIRDPNRYLPVKPSFFDQIFRKLGVETHLSGNCSWENYKEFLETVTELRDLMMQHYSSSDIDLLDAHSFLWTAGQDVLEMGTEKKVEPGALIFHKDYGEGIITSVTDENIYVAFGEKARIFSNPEAFEKGYLELV